MKKNYDTQLLIQDRSIYMATLDERTSNTALDADDLGSLISCTGTWTQTLTEAATLGNGWYCYIKNAGTGDITIDPDGTEEIDGLTSFVMYPGEARLIQCNGTAFYSVVKESFYRAFTASGTFTKPPGYSEFRYLLWGGGASGAKNNEGTNRAGGAGGSCVKGSYRSDELGATEAIVIGAGGTAVSSNGTGLDGGDSTFNGLTAYGGDGGTTGTIGADAFFAVTEQAGESSAISGAYTTSDDTTTLFGGTGGDPNNNAYGYTVYGGACGGGIDSGNTVRNTGVGRTVYGGDGGNAAAGGGTAGTSPGGGGGACYTGSSGAGADGEFRIWGII